MMTAIHPHHFVSEWTHLLRVSVVRFIREPLGWLFVILGLISFGIFLYYFFAQPHPQAPWHSYFP